MNGWYKITFSNSCWQSLGNRRIGRSLRRWEDRSEIALRETRFGFVKLIYLDGVRVKTVDFWDRHLNSWPSTLKQECPTESCDFCCVEFTVFIPLFILPIFVTRLDEEELHSSKARINTRWTGVFGRVYVLKYVLWFTLIYIIIFNTSSLSWLIFSTNI